MSRYTGSLRIIRGEVPCSTEITVDGITVLQILRLQMLA